MIYQLKTGSRLPVSAQVAGETLEAIREVHGTLTARAVVAESRCEDAPLHGCFEWRDGIAAERYREQQAREVIRSVRVQFTDEPKLEPTYRAYVHLEAKGEESYVPIRLAMEDRGLRAQVVSKALEELRTWRERYRQYDELASVFQALEQSGLELD